MLKPIRSILYITNARIPTEKAHGYQIAKMCEAYADLGIKLKLIVPARANEIKEDIYDYYKVKRNFETRYAWTLDLMQSGLLPKFLTFFLARISFFISATFLRTDDESIIYTRSPEIAWQFSLRGKPVIFECHQMPENNQALFFKALKRSLLITTSSKGMKEDLAEAMPFFEKEKILPMPNGIDPEVFLSDDVSKPEARRALDLPQDKKIILYTGHLYSWKGVDTLAEAARLRPECDFYFIGGTADDMASFKIKYALENIHLIDFQPRDRIVTWLKAADVLVLPNSPINQLSERHTSPIKMFEYMSSGTPIIASDLPSIKEILDIDTCAFFTPDDRLSLSQEITRLLKNPDERKRLGMNAKARSVEYTWKRRANKIIERAYGQK